MKTIYVGSLYERVSGSGGFVEEKHYIYTPLGRTAVRTVRSDASVETRYFHQDGLGSISAVTDERARVEKRFTFDAWGKRVKTTDTHGANGGVVARGYTDHEHLDDFGLVHMNGRVYDPVLGRFLSADPFVGNVGDSQEYNRYSYLGNNPLGGTDPSGYFSLKDAAMIVVAVVAGIVTAGVALYAYAAVIGGVGSMTFSAALSSVFLAGSWSGGWAVVAGAGFGFGSSFAASLLNGGSIGDAFKTGAIGGLVGGISAGIASQIGDYAQANEWFQGAGQNLAHGALQGGLTEATGGEFRHGFYAGFFSSASAGSIQEAMPNNIGARTAAAAVVGGTASAVGGGKFANGAVSGAFTYLFNHAKDHSSGDGSWIEEKVSQYGKRDVLKVLNAAEEYYAMSLEAHEYAFATMTEGSTVADMRAAVNAYSQQKVGRDIYGPRTQNASNVSLRTGAVFVRPYVPDIDPIRDITSFVYNRLSGSHEALHSVDRAAVVSWYRYRPQVDAVLMSGTFTAGTEVRAHQLTLRQVREAISWTKKN